MAGESISEMIPIWLQTYFCARFFRIEEPIFLEPQPAIDVNRETILDDFTQAMLEREAFILELLIQEGYFVCGGKLHENTQNGIV